MHKKLSLLLIGFAFSFNLMAGGNEPRPVAPNEGMWLPHLIKAMNIDDMRQLGFKLSAEDIYSVNKASIKDAVVQLGGFCTAEVVSPEGLLFTNHHCAFDAVATHSDTDHDYLTDGFWAMNKKEELNTPGLTVSFLQRIEDVTKKVTDAGDAAEEGMSEMAMQEAMTEIKEAAAEDGLYSTKVKAMFNGNQYLLFVYEIYRDIRLVGAPPSSIGKFGGDTDNWMWPRHTGDFAVLRIYAGPDNKPADYSEDNVPYKPKHYFPVSIKGVKNGDFAMTMGYPGSTDRYLSSFAIRHTYEDDNPVKIDLMGERLRLMKNDMDASDEVRIRMASSYASLANYYKYCIGQNRGLRQRGLIEEREAFESKFTQWVNSDTKRKEKYGNVLDQFKQNYSSSKEILNLRNYTNFAGFGPGFVNYGVGFWRAKRMMGMEGKEDAVKGQFERMQAGLDEHFAEYFPKTDVKILASMARMFYNGVPKAMHPDVFTSKAFTKAKAKGDMDRFDVFAANVFKKSILVDKARAKAFLANPSLKVLEKDLGVQYAESMVSLYINKLNTEAAMFDAVNEEGMKAYQAGMHEMAKAKKFYPDANSTMRMSYGKIIPYDPRDAVSYKSQTYAEGVLEKEKPGDQEFHVDPKLHDLIMKKDYGQYGENGKLPLCFLSDNDITGGNSGSPVINGNGELIGIAFDGNWESMTSDLVFDDDIVRTISVDIRYVLFVIDKFAGAGHLVKELKLMK